MKSMGSASAALLLAACGGGGAGAVGGADDPPAVAPAALNAQIVLTNGGIPGGGGINEVETMNLDGSHLRVLTNDGKNKFLPHFSPDGRQLVYSKFLTGNYSDPSALTDIAVYDFASHTEILLTHTGTAFQPTWSPDGRHIAYGSRAGDGLWLMNADASGAYKLATPSGAPTDLSWGDFDTAGSYRTKIADGFGPDWKPLAR